MKRNRIEISAYKYSQKDAEIEANRIITERISKVRDAKAEWSILTNKIISNDKEIERLINESTRLALSDKEEDNDTRIVILSTIDDLQKVNKELSITNEPLRIAKIKAIKKLNIKAWQLQPVFPTGKKGGNWVFQSKN